MLAAPKRQVQHQATAGRAVLRNASRDSCGFAKGSERIWRAQELLSYGDRNECERDLFFLVLWTFAVPSDLSDFFLVANFAEDRSLELKFEPE